MFFLHSLQNHPLGILLRKLAPSQVWEKRPSLIFSLCAFTVVSSLLLGGGTRGGFLSDTILELFAIPAFLVSLSSLFVLPWTQSKHRAQWALMFCLAIVLVPLIQLVPLPPWIWTRLPHREEMAAVFDLLGRERPWLPVSVSPSATWLSVLSLLPPFAIFLGMIQLSYRERRSLSLILLGVGILGVFVGMIQVAQGPSSPLRFFAFTSGEEPVGFFANRNHFAALLYALLLFAAAWATNVAFTVGSLNDRKSLETVSVAALTARFLVIVILIAAEIMTGSRAGLGLMIVALVGAFALPVVDRRRSSGLTPVKLMFGSTILIIVLIVQFALYRILDKFAVDSIMGARTSIARNTIAAAKAYMPFGSGIGTFVPVYSMFELPNDEIANVYVNRAHNDLLEVWLEGGVISIILVGAFVTWLVLRSIDIWWRAPTNVSAFDLLLARAATMAIPLIIAHSFVDYPLRTEAMMAVFAFCCALLVEPLIPALNEMKFRPRRERERSGEEIPRVAAPQAPRASDVPAGTSEKPSRQPPERWGEDIDWPDQWRK
jgi:O-antigen ligase